MPREDVKRFFETVRGDTALQVRLQELPGKHGKADTVEAVVAMAAESGFQFSVEEYLAVFKETLGTADGFPFAPQWKSETAPSI